MKACDVVGYARDGAIYCAECGESSWDPVFADSETDSPSSCDECGVLIPEQLTPDGVRYVREALYAWAAHGDGDPDVLRSWVAEWPHVLDAEPDDFSLLDDGTMDTVVGLPNGREYRYDGDTVADYRDAVTGALDFPSFVADVVLPDWENEDDPYGLEGGAR